MKRKVYVAIISCLIVLSTVAASGCGSKQESVGKASFSESMPSANVDIDRTESKAEESTTQQGQESKTAAEFPKQMVVMADELLLRTGPGQENNAVNILNFGKVIDVYEISDNWARTKVDGSDLWCSCTYLAEAENGGIGDSYEITKEWLTEGSSFKVFANYALTLWIYGSGITNYDCEDADSVEKMLDVLWTYFMFQNYPVEPYHNGEANEYGFATHYVPESSIQWIGENIFHASEEQFNTWKNNHLNYYVDGYFTNGTTGAGNAPSLVSVDSVVKEGTKYRISLTANNMGEGVSYEGLFEIKEIDGAYYFTVYSLNKK